jgi:2-iminobutanoate/2-iminopropanoate deaminase
MSAARFMMIPGAPAPVAPFSHAVEVDGWMFLTGQMPTDPNDDSAPLPAGIEAQSRRVMDNLILVLNGAGLGLEHVVAARAFLTNFARDYGPMNAWTATGHKRRVGAAAEMRPGAGVWPIK